MDIINKKNFLFEDVSTIKGVGKKLATYLRKKKIEKVSIYFKVNELNSKSISFVPLYDERYLIFFFNDSNSFIKEFIIY